MLLLLFFRMVLSDIRQVCILAVLSLPHPFPLGRDGEREGIVYSNFPSVDHFVMVGNFFSLTCATMLFGTLNKYQKT